MTDDLTVSPWRTIETWLVYAHPDLCLHEYQILGRDGALSTRHRLGEPASTRVVAVDTDGQLILIWHWRYSLGYPGIELPSTPVEPGQDPLRAARRALRDGCGLAAASWTRIGTITAVTSVAAQPVHIYRAERLHRVPQPAGDGTQVAFTMPYDVAVGSAVTGAIPEAASAAALLRVEQERLAGVWQLPTSPPPPPPTGRLRL